MIPLTGKKIVVSGGSRGVGRRVVDLAASNGGRVLAVARQEGPLRRLAQEVPGADVLSLDATDEAAPAKVFDVLQPDVLVLSAGDRKSTRLNSSHANISYAVFCLKKKKSRLCRPPSGLFHNR